MKDETATSLLLASVLANGKSTSHGSEIKRAIQASDDIFISVAFLKTTGLEQIIDDLRKALARGCKLTAVVGLDFWLTDPAALDALSSLRGEYPKCCSLHVFRPHTTSTYHPKYYRFRKNDGVLLVVGSANLTSGGLSKNVEASVLCRAPNTSDLAKGTVAFERVILDDPRCFVPSFQDLLHYESEHSIYRKARKRAERTAKDEIAKLVKLDSATLQQHLNLYRASTDQQADLKRRKLRYGEARTLLTDKFLTSEDLTAAAFKKHYGRLVGESGGVKLWHSGSVHRQKNLVGPRFALVQAMIREVGHNLGLPPRQMFALGKRWMQKIPHLGPNVFTEICNTLQPDRYAVLNNNPTTSLHALGLGAFPNPTTFSPAEYEKFCAVLADLRDKCGFKDFGETDHFLNYIYWKTKKASTPKHTQEV